LVEKPGIDIPGNSRKEWGIPPSAGSVRSIERSKVPYRVG
jgi:hypothetical protein